jgi:benzoate/toluate 1,2-dioxygenase beta subunit
MDELGDRCEQFVYAEAELLDEGNLEAWVELFSEDGSYWLPLDTTRREPRGGLNIVYDDRRRLQDRVARLRSGHAHSEDPLSATQHLIGNVRVLPRERAADIAGSCVLAEDDLVVSGRSIVSRVRRDETDVFPARVSWILRPEGDSFRIRMKRVDLLGARGPMPMLTFIV